MKPKPFNPIEMLHTDAEISEYLAEAYQDDDPATFITALGFVVKHKGVAKIAEDTGLNRESLYTAFDGQPRWDTVQRLLKVLGIRLTFAT
ncbi:MAG: addiction module antidote protein [Pseudomonadales bacterium]